MSDLVVYDLPGVIGRIVEQKRIDLQSRQQRVARERLEADLSTDTRDFHAALTAADLGLIAEFKPRSPSRGVLRSVDEADSMAAIFERYAAAISVLCDEPFFGGRLSLLSQIRAQTTLPVLCKDFFISEYQVVEARAAGADAVLLLASLLPFESLSRLLELCRQLDMAALVEVHDDDQLAVATRAGAAILGVNSRDMRNLSVDAPRARQLLERIPEDTVRVAESGIQTREDVDQLRGLVNAVLIGSSLMMSSSPATTIEALGWQPCR
jgi:indole-3-glycerol phosphate synthase